MQWPKLVTAAIFGGLATFEAIGFGEKLGYIAPDLHWRSQDERAARELDRKFVDALISRYKDTVDIAEQESKSGHNQQLKRLAAGLLESRKKDIALLMEIRQSAELAGR